MIDASSAKKSLKRFVGLVESIMDSSDPEERDSALSDLMSYSRENSGVIREAATEDTSQLISYLVVAVYKSGSDKLDELLEVVRQIDPNNSIVGEYEIVSLLDKEAYTEIIDRVTSDPGFSKSDGVMDVLRKSARMSGKYSEVARYLAENGLYDAEFFAEYCKKDMDSDTNSSIIEALESEDSRENEIAFLESVTSHSDSPGYLLRLVNLYMKSGEEEKLKGVLERLDPSDVEGKQDYLDIASGYDQISEYGKALLFTNSGLSSHRNDRDLMLMKARMLVMLRREGEASETLSELVDSYPKDDVSIRLAASLSYKSEQFKETLKYIGLLRDLTELELSDYIMLVDSEIRSSLFDEAGENLDHAISKFGPNLDLFKYKLKLETTINDRNESYSTALEILKLDPLNSEAIDIKFTYLFDQQEYRDVVDDLDEIGSDPVREKYLDIYATSLIYLNKFHAFLKVMKGKPELVDSGYVLDAVYYTVRDDEKIKDILDFLKEIKPPSGVAMKIVLNRLLSVRPLYGGEAAAVCLSTRSFALGYIITSASIDFREKKRPEEADTILSNAYFKEVSATMDLIQQIYGMGEKVSGLSDSPRLIYPVVAALVDVGKHEAAREVLDRSYDSKLNDPFYYYYDAILNFRKGNSGAARKSIRRALSRLTNNEFLTLEAEIMLSEGDFDDVRDTLVKLADRGIVQSINFEEIYKYVTGKEDFKAGKGLSEALSSYSIDNIWLNKLNRDVRLKEGDNEGALEYSKLVVSAKRREFADIRIHAELLDKLGKEEQKLAFFLDCSGPNESATIDLWVGDAYYGKKNFEDALEYYNSAIAKGTDAFEIINLPDTLVETGHLDEAARLISKLKEPGLLKIKLYYAQGNTEGIVKLLSTSDLVKQGEEDKLEFIVDKLWHNKLVRDALVKAYRREGYLFLGKLVAQKMIESGDNASAAGILENMLKNYPADLSNVASLADVYVSLGRVNEAVELLLNSLKHATGFEQGMALVNRLMRIYYEERDFSAVVKFYESNKEYVDRTSAQYLIRSLISMEEFDRAEELLGKYEGNLVDRELNSEILQEINAKREFSEILIYVRRLLKLEYTAGKTFSMKEALYKAEIPIEKIDEVFDFLKSEQYYSEVNEEKYEILSRDVFQELAKKTRVESIRDVRINVIFNNLPSRDVIVAKNLYIYIRRSMETVREPKIHDDVLIKLLKLALRDNLRPEPLAVAVNLDVGISDALEVISLMKYMEEKDRKGGR